MKIPLLMMIILIYISMLSCDENSSKFSVKTEPGEIQLLAKENYNPLSGYTLELFLKTSTDTSNLKKSHLFIYSNPLADTTFFEFTNAKDARNQIILTNIITSENILHLNDVFNEGPIKSFFVLNETMKEKYGLYNVFLKTDDNFTDSLAAAYLPPAYIESFKNERLLYLDLRVSNSDGKITVGTAFQKFIGSYILETDASGSLVKNHLVGSKLFIKFYDKANQFIGSYQIELSSIVEKGLAIKI